MGNFQIKLYQVERKPEEQHELKKVSYNKSFTPAQFWKTALLSIVIAVLSLSLNFILSITLVNIVHEEIFEYYLTGFDFLTSIFGSNVSFTEEELGVNWKDILLFLHLQGGSMQAFFLGRPEDFSLFENMLEVEYHQGIVGLLLIPFIFIIVLIRAYKRWLPTNSYLLISFSGITSFFYALLLTIIAFTNNKLIDASSVYGNAEIFFHYDLLHIFTITFIFVLLFTYLAVKFVLRRSLEERKKERKLDIILLAMKTISFVFVGAISTLFVLVVFEGIFSSSSVSILKDILITPKGIVLAIPFAFYLLNLLFGGSLLFTSTDNGVIQYSITNGYMYADNYYLNEINDFFLLFSSNIGMKIMMYMLLLLPVIVLARTGYQLAKHSVGHRLWPTFIYSLVTASILFLLAYVSKLGYIYMGHSEFTGYIALSELLELEEEKVFFKSFLLSQVSSLLGGFLYISKLKEK